MKHIFFSVLTALAIGGCKAPETPKKQAFQAYVRYLADVKQVRAEATFTEGDVAPQPVEMKGGVSFQGLPMKLRPIQGITYQTDYSSEFTPTFQFNWSPVASQPPAEYVAGMAPLTGFRFDQEPLSIHSPNTLRWQGNQVEDGEVIVFIWERIGDGLTVKMEVIQNLYGSEIKFPAAKLAELQPGRWKLYLVRKRLRKGDVGGVQVQAITEYYTPTDTLEVKN